MSANAKALEAEVHKLRSQLKQRRARMKTEVAKEREACARLTFNLDTCAHCHEGPAVCVGRYDGEPEAAACDECCGHGNVAGHCKPVAQFIEAAIRARDEADTKS